MKRRRRFTDIKKLVRPSIVRLIPYSSARSDFSGRAQIRLDANENNIGSAIKIPEYLSELNRYPDPLQHKLRAEVAKIYKLSADHIFAGNGSDEAINLLMQVFCEPGRHSVLVTPPSYAMYDVIAGTLGIKIQKAALSASFNLRIESIKRKITSDTRIVFICSPNNPTGNSFALTDIIRILSFYRGILVVDEAYQEFSSQQSASSLLAKFPNLVVLRTLSKAWGLAGLRVGFALADPYIVSMLQKIKTPYNVSSIAQELALRALKNKNFLRESINTIRAERARLGALLALSPHVVRVYKSDSSFFLVKFKEAKSTFSKLLSAGIVTRDRSSVPGCKNCLRISIGTMSENDLLLRALDVSLTDLSE